MFWVQRAFTIYPWDYPEIFSISSWGGYSLGWPVILMGCIVYLLISIRPRLHLILFPVFILVLFSASSYSVIKWQFAYSRSVDVGPLSDQGRALRNILPEAERSRGLIIGSSRYGKMSYFLFGFSSDAWVLVVPEGESITLDMIPPNIDWVVLLDHYDVNIPIKSSMRTGEMWLGWLSPHSPSFDESVELWDGKPLHFKFSAGESTYMLDQFNEPESWGVWSATDGARILLPIIISGKVRIEIDGWINPLSLTQKLNLLVGSTLVPVPFDTDRGTSCMVIDLSNPAQVITLRGVKPFRQNSWEPLQAVALTELNIFKASDAPVGACLP
jgi:hypothetical protein